MHGRSLILLRRTLPRLLLLAICAVPPACTDQPQSLSLLAKPTTDLLPEADVAKPGGAQPAAVNGSAPLPPHTTGVAASAVLVPGQPLTFDQAFSIVEQRNATLVQLRSALERSRINYQSVAAGYASDWQGLVVGNVEPPLEQATIANRIGSYYDQTGVELRWTPPWWHKEGIKYDAQSSQIDIASAEQDYAAGLGDQAVKLLKNYIAVRQYQEKLRVSAEQLKVDQARRDVMLKGSGIGTASELSLITQEADLLNQQAITGQLKDELLQKEQALFDTLNIPDSAIKYCTNYFEYFSFDPSGWPTDWALKEQTRSLKLQIAKQEIQTEKARLTWQPNLSVRASYGRQYNLSNSGTQDVVGLGVVLTVPLPNFPQASAQQALAQHDMTNLMTQLDQTEANTRRTAARDRERIPALAANLRTRLRAMAEYDKELASTRHSFELGLIDYLQVQTVENSIMQNTETYYDDLAEYFDLVVDFARLSGRPFPVPTSCTAR